MPVKWWRRLPANRDGAADMPPPSARDLRDERLSASLDGALTPGEQAALDADLALDGELQQELDQLRLVTSLLATLEIERAPRSFALPAPPPRPARAGFRQLELFMRIGAATAALAFVVVLAGDLGGGGDTGTPVTSAPATGAGQATDAGLALTESFDGESPAAGDTSGTGGGSTERNAAGASGAAEAPAGTGPGSPLPGGAGGGLLPDGGTEPGTVEPEIAPAIASDGGPGSPVDGQEEGIAPEPAIAPVDPESGANGVATDGTGSAAPGGVGGGWSAYPPPRGGGGGAGGAGGMLPDAAMSRFGGGPANGVFDVGTATRYTVTTRVSVDGLLVAEIVLGALTIALVLGLVLLRSARRAEL